MSALPKEQYNAWRRRRLDAGLCQACGEPRGEEGTATWCGVCAEIRREVERKRYAEKVRTLVVRKLGKGAAA